MDKVKRDTTLGLVFFGGLALLLWATQELNNVSWTPKQRVTVDFENARSLRTGEPVFVLGTRNGKVTNVFLRTDGEKLAVRAHLELDTTVEFKDDAVVKVVDSSFLGGKRVEITPGLTGVAVETDTHVFDGIAPFGPLDALGDLISGDENKENLQGALKGVREFVDKLNKSEGSLARFIEDDTLIKDAEALVASIRKSAEELQKKQSLLGLLIYDEGWGTKADKIIADVAKVTDNLNKKDSGLLGAMINDEVLLADAKKIFSDFSEITEKVNNGKGAIGRLINDEKMGERLDKIVADVEKVADNLNKKDSGLLGAMINDEVLLADAKKIFSDFSEITEKVNNGKGAIGRLINDEDMGRRLDSMLRQVTRAIEDAREAAPIGTFFQVFSGAF